MNECIPEAVLATALPRIASVSPRQSPIDAALTALQDFDAFTLQGWVASSFVLAQTVFLLFYGQIMCIYPAKWVLVATITFFETGFLICGVAQNARQLIVGRTVSGMGAAGMCAYLCFFSCYGNVIYRIQMVVSMIQIITQVTRLQDRPRLFGAFGAVFGLSSVIGPRIGGALTDHVSLPISRFCCTLPLIYL